MRGTTRAARRRPGVLFSLILAMGCAGFVGVVAAAADRPAEPDDAVRNELIVRDRYNMSPPPVAGDPSVKFDYDIVYVRAPLGKYVWPDVGAPILVEPGADLMMLHPDGSEEMLVEGGDKGSVADPYVSFDGQWVFYAYFYATHGACGRSCSTSPSRAWQRAR
jgi:hypothetical protein